MSETYVSYVRTGSIALIRMDDGKRNALGPPLLTRIGQALDRAEGDGATVVLTGREDTFSAGFDLKVLRRGGPSALKMLHGGFALAERLLTFPRPVVIAVNGHAMAMGAFLVLSGDYRIGARGDYLYVTNEVALGLTMPRAGVEICRQRLSPAHFVRAAALAEPYKPADAAAAGFVDRVVEPEELLAEAQAVAERLSALDMRAHTETKLRVRRAAIAAIRRGRARDTAEFAALGVKRALRPSKARNG